MEIGARIRKIRSQQGRTIQEVADASQCSKGLLSKIETGKIVPALGTLSKISKALNVRVSALMEDGDSENPAYTPRPFDSPEAFIPTSKGYSIFAFAPHITDKKMQPMMVRSKKGEVRPHLLSHDGEEFIYILRGEVQIQIGKMSYKLKEGESIYFDSVNEHGVQPLSEIAYYLDILYESL
jgi:transcriptional regulator with XRE-family HTH domain